MMEGMSQTLAPDQDAQVIAQFQTDYILPDYPNIGTPKDASIALGVPESTIRQLCRQGTLRAFKCGTNWKIPHAWLLDFINGGGCR